MRWYTRLGWKNKVGNEIVRENERPVKTVMLQMAESDRSCGKPGRSKRKSKVMMVN